MSDYPDSSELRKIKRWDCVKNGFEPLMQFARAIYPDYGSWKIEDDLHKVATGGWSGCEDVIYALQSNSLFWSMCWQKSERGGYYEFRKPEKMP